MPRYNPKNERTKRDYFRFLKEADRKSEATIDAVRKAIDRFEDYTGRKDFATFNKEQAIGFKKHLARCRARRTGQPMAKSTLLATTNALKDFFRWLVPLPGYRGRFGPNDIEYLNLSENETRAATAPRFKPAPTMEQIRAVLAAMPATTEVERRNRALIAMTILTGARDSALASLRLKHVDLERRLVMQDPREVRTKRSKRIDTFFFPVGEDFEAEPVAWVRYLREEKLYGLDDPVFPRTRVRADGNGSFAADGVEPVFWGNTEPIRRIFREAFARAGLPYFRPHSFRDTLVQHGERHAPTIEHFKAWSQNLGHEHLATTLTSYGNISTHRQGELVRAMAGADETDADEAKYQELFKHMVRTIKSGGSAGA